MKYIVLDCEFNCVPFGWDKVKDVGLQNEIIEIGAVKLDKNFSSIAKFQTFVRPRIYAKINQKIKKMTRISQNQLNQAPDFKVAFWDFLSWIREGEYILCSWGKDDITTLNKHCKYYNFNYHCSTFIDVQKSFQDYYGIEKQISLKDAIEHYYLDGGNTYHFAANDSEYTAEILKILSKCKRFKAVSSDIK